LGQVLHLNGGGKVTNVCVYLTHARILSPITTATAFMCNAAADALRAAMVQQAAAASEHAATLSKLVTPVTAGIFELAHDIIHPGHAIDALALVYFHCEALEGRNAVVLHTSDAGGLDVDVVYGPPSSHPPLWAYCLQVGAGAQTGHCSRFSPPNIATVRHSLRGLTREVCPYAT